jgi:NADH-quinone oxidoreductase subunit E
VRGSSKILQHLKNEFGIKEGETTPDRLLTLETVGCIGCCGLAPVAVVNDEAIGDVDFERTSEIIRRVKKVESGSEEIREVEERRRP